MNENKTGTTIQAHAVGQIARCVSDWVKPRVSELGTKQ